MTVCVVMIAWGVLQLAGIVEASQSRRWRRSPWAKIVLGTVGAAVLVYRRGSRPTRARAWLSHDGTDRFAELVRRPGSPARQSRRESDQD
jgi:hypothetical protein